MEYNEDFLKQNMVETRRGDFLNHFGRGKS